MSEIKNRRIDYLDLARGICMICIVLGHLGNDGINHVVFTFHLPVFYLITGFFHDPKAKVTDILKKRFRTLIIPYFFACICIMVSYLIINLGILHTDPASIKERIFKFISASIYAAGDSWDHPFIIPGIGAIWFLWATFWGSLILHLLLRIGPVKRTVIIFALVFFAKWTVDKYLFLPLSIQPGCTAVIFMYAGYLWKENKETIDKLPQSVKAVAGTAALVVWYEFIKNFKSFWLVHSYYGRGYIDIVGSLCASFAVISICCYLDRYAGKFLKPLYSLGKYSIIALTAHIIELNTFPWGKILNDLLGEGYSDRKALFVKIAIKLPWMFLVTFIFYKIRPVRFIFNIRTKSRSKAPVPDV